jgi:integrase
MKTPGIRRTTKGWEVSASHEGQRRTAVCKTKGEATAKRKELQAMLYAKCVERADTARAGTITLGEAYERSMKTRWEHTVWKKEVQCYADQCMDFLGWTKRLTEVDRTDLAALQQHFIAQGNAAATINKKLGIVRALFIDALDDGLISKKAPLPKPLKEANLKDEVFSKQEEQAFAEWFRQAGHEELADMFLFAIDTCARAGELRALQAHHFSLYGDGKGSVTFEERKANNLGSVPLTARAYAIAQKYSKTEGRIWKINAKQVIALFNQAKEALGLEHRPRLTWHCTRHTCATRLAAGNVSLAMICTFGGWTSLKSVKRYLHIQTDALDPCIQALEG